MTQLDPRRATPVYRQLAKILKDRIEAGDYAPDLPIPSEKQLVQEFGISRETARRAVALLRESGAVYTVPQRGTYVSPPADSVT